MQSSYSILSINELNIILIYNYYLTNFGVLGIKGLHNSNTAHKPKKSLRYLAYREWLLHERQELVSLSNLRTHK